MVCNNYTRQANTTNENRTMKQINGIPTEYLAAIVAGLVREGVTFECFPDRCPGEWKINLLGGY